MKKLWIILFPLLLLAEPPSVEQLFNIQTVKVKKETTGFKKKFYGLLKADEKNIVNIVPRFSGYIVKLYINRTYSYVKKGEPLAKVYSPEIFKAKEEYINALEFSKKHNDRGMVESAKRKLQLLGISDNEINQYAKNRKIDPYTTIFAPKSGYIFKKEVVEGSSFNAKSPIFQIINLENLWIEAKISEPDIPLILRARRFYFTTKAVSGIFEANHPFLYPVIDPKNALATLRLNVKNIDKKLFPGMFATLYAKSEPKTMLTLPRTAVIRKMNRWYVFKAGEFEGEYEPVDVVIKPIDNKRYAIISGLKEGDEVVNNVLFLIDSDAQINGLF
ncbi:efflux RND transporter periplasmic adaptor subunit [Hydrogenimonas thermophila]|uniref:efflux RND transporter periplasmic adaptor subunit n=1 Tax=Hydrogenimonas thermophila TaxID=223786 RepID=UPI002936E720|nr:efflux RND transporter periplasmic adaptor subunit [Hydrogenimonas thermophila]WOE70794.1 efflux RND transporter periplasmic adaptor subunit [Hydrogenimonas thermophila]WOE73312.1 efflux RND transporter periplasmic adaptor subunit [Hydrogenimonas thermophila]